MTNPVLDRGLEAAKKIPAANAEIAKTTIGREEALDALWTALAADCAVFLFGDPGTAKTQVAQAVARQIKGAKFWDMLMPGIGTTSDMFVEKTSIRETDHPDGKDITVREVLGRAATADIVCTDELFKVKTPQVLNGLLDLMRVQGVRHDGVQGVDHAKVVVAISNEVPEKGGDFDALYARLILRVTADHLALPGLKRMVRANIAHSQKGSPPPTPHLEYEDMEALQKATAFVDLPDAMIELVYQIILELSKKDADGFRWLVTDNRRFGEIARCLQAHALIHGRQRVEKADLIVLSWACWGDPGQIPMLKAVLRPHTWTPLIEAQELFDSLLMAGGNVEQVLSKTKDWTLKLTDAGAQCKTMTTKLAELRGKTSDAEAAQISDLLRQVEEIHKKLRLSI